MKKILISLLALLLAACGGGGGAGTGACSTCSTGSSIPVGSFSGAAFDGLIINGTIRVYDFTTGAKGALLGSAMTDSLGLYSLSLQVESRPVLIEITGGYYVEEAGGNANIALTTNHKLSAVTYYTTGTALRVAVTTYSHMAVGLAQYLITTGMPVVDAINAANARASSMAGVNILTTTPKEITDVTNASASLTPELKYGFIAGAISYWTYTHAPSPASAHLSPYTSIDFAQLMYQDVTADGLLDGIGKDTTGAALPLSFGTTALDQSVYRLGLGTAMVQMAGNPNNKTGLGGDKLLPFAQGFIANTDPTFNNVPPVAFPISTVSITSPAAGVWNKRVVSIIPASSSPFGWIKSELLVDGAVLSSSSAAVPTFTLDTALHTDGQHTVAVRTTDVGGRVSTASILSNFDNTPPTTTTSAIWQAMPRSSIVIGVSGTASDASSGVASVQIVGFAAPVAPVAGAWSFYGDYLGSTVRVTDAVGNCADYSDPTRNATWTTVASPSSACP